MYIATAEEIVPRGGKMKEYCNKVRGKVLGVTYIRSLGVPSVGMLPQNLFWCSPGTARQILCI